MNMSGNSLIWTAQTSDEDSDRMAPRIEGNSSNLVVWMSSGTSVYVFDARLPVPDEKLIR